MKKKRFIILVIIVLFSTVSCNQTEQKKEEMDSSIHSITDEVIYRSEEKEKSNPSIEVAKRSGLNYFYSKLVMDDRNKSKIVESSDEEKEYEEYIESSMNGDLISKKKIYDIEKVVAYIEKTKDGNELLIIKESREEDKYPMTIYGYIVDCKKKEERETPNVKDFSDYYDMAIADFINDEEQFAFTFVPSELEADCLYDNYGPYKTIKYNVRLDYSIRSGIMVLDNQDNPVWLHYYETSGDRSVIYIYECNKLKCIMDYGGQTATYDEQYQNANVGGMIYIYLFDCNDVGENGYLVYQLNEI